MQIITQLSRWQTIRDGLKSDRTPQIGFVPTMGCLHEGHASLIKRSIQENAITVVSLFVNPTQFNDTSDYDHYPRTDRADHQLCATLGASYLIQPDEQAIYPNGNGLTVKIDHPLATILEGKYRPNHFNGVLTVIMKWLNLVRPHRLYLGEKDYQQYRLVESMVRDCFIPTEVIACPTIRDSEGLAFSSRNNRLSCSEKILAQKFAKLVQQCTPTTLKQTHALMKKIGIQPEYLAIHDNRLYAAAYIGSIRLIDNITLKGE